MEKNDEFHDPDYHEPSTSTSAEETVVPEEDKVQKIRKIVEKEFANEIKCRQDELLLIEQKLWWSRVQLHRLRTKLVSQYYNSSLTNTQIEDQIAEHHEPRAKATVTSILENQQKRLHPSVKKLLGKNNVDLEEIFKFREPRNAVRKNYMAMLQKKTSNAKLRRQQLNSNAESKDAKASVSSKAPRAMQPTATQITNVKETNRIDRKYRYQIIIGNTSKYAPPSSKVDRSTHKWLLYVRGPESHPDVSVIVTSVCVTLHESYAPHHQIVLDSAPFYISRRGWGEFAAKVQLHFKLPDFNRPIVVDHVIKLDRNYTGLQTLGAETILDVWLYSNADMIKHAFYDDDDEEEEKPVAPPKEEPIIPKVEIKTEIPDPEENDNSDWFNYFTEPAPLPPPPPPPPEIKKEKPDCLEESKRFMKYIDSDTGKIYYLEMDRALDVNTVQEIVIKERTVPSQVKLSPLKNGYTKYDYTHIENDHCYTSRPKLATNVIVNKTRDVYKELCQSVAKFACIKVAVNFLLSKIPLICDLEEYNNELFPFVVNNEELYWSLDVIKRRNIEWSRAKLINKILFEHFKSDSPIWRTKQILLYARLHGYYPMRGGDSGGDVSGDSEREDRAHVTLTSFDDGNFKDEGCCEIDLTLDDEMVDIVGLSDYRTVKIEKELPPEMPPQLEVLILDDIEKRKLFLFIENTCLKLGIVLWNQDIGHGYSYSIVHALIHCAMKKFAEELIRSALAYKMTSRRKEIKEANGLPYLPIWESCDGVSLEVSDISRGASWRLSSVTNQSLGIPKILLQIPH